MGRPFLISPILLIISGIIIEKINPITKTKTIIARNMDSPLDFLPKNLFIDFSILIIGIFTMKAIQIPVIKGVKNEKIFKTKVDTA